MFALGQVGVEHVGPGDMQAGTPLGELVDGPVRASVDAELEHAHVGPCGHEQANCSASEMQFDNRTGLLGDEHGHVVEALPCPGAEPQRVVVDIDIVPGPFIEAGHRAEAGGSGAPVSGQKSGIREESSGNRRQIELRRI